MSQDHPRSSRAKFAFQYYVRLYHRKPCEIISNGKIASLAEARVVLVEVFARITPGLSSFFQN